MTSSPPGPDVGPEPGPHPGIAARRLHSQRLTGTGFSDAAAAVGWFGAVQSQLFAGAAWGIGQRCSNLSDAALRAAFDAGAIIRTHVLRPTWHFVAPADLRWMLALSAPQVHAASAFYYRKEGLDDALFHRCADVLVDALEGDQHLTRAEMAAELGCRGIPAEGNRLAYIVMWCELQAIVCSGPMRGRQHTYALVDERVPPSPERGADWALAELARRYFTSHGPARIHDFAWWSGLRVTAARKAVALAAGDLEEDRIGGTPYFCGPAFGNPSPIEEGGPDLHLLPNYDEFVVAYQDRAALFAIPERARAFGGMEALTNNLIVHRGRVVGTWKPTVTADHVTLAVTGIAGDAARSLEAAVSRYERFIGLPVEVAPFR